MEIRNLIRMSSILALVVFVAVLSIGCDSKSTLDTETPDGSTIAISATPTTLNTGETSVVEATVTSNSTGLADQVVRFTVSPSNAGYFTPEYDTTAADGIAATVFTASTSGSVVISATVQGTSISAPLNLAISEPSGGGAGDGNLNVTVSNVALTANGSDQSTVTVVVRDGLGQPAPDSTLVKIVAGEKFVDLDGNGYWSTNVDSLVFDANGNGIWDPIGVVVSTAFTSGGAGEVSVVYTAGDAAATVYVKVTVDAAGLAGSVDVPIQLLPNALVNSIYLASDSMSLAVMQTGGIETSTLRATCYDVNGNTVPEGLPVIFSIIDGPGGGERLADLAVDVPDSVYTNSQGMAVTTIHSGTVSGTVRVRAQAGSVLSQATQILIAAGPPADIAIAPDTCNVPYWRCVGCENAVVAIVSDIYNNPVNDSTVVYFTCDEGVMMSHQARTMEGKGLAPSLWMANYGETGADGIVWIYAETSGGTVRDSSWFYNTDVPFTISVVNWRDNIQADGSDRFFAWITTVDLNGNPVVDGTPFKADAGILSVAGGAFHDGCSGSGDRVQVLSRTLEEDASMNGVSDDGIGAVDYVTYWHAGGAALTLVCSLTTGYAHAGMSSVSGETNVAPGVSIFLSCTIVDRFGNPLGDHVLNLTEDGTPVGTLRTNNYGETPTLEWAAPMVDGDYYIRIDDSDPRGGITLIHKVTVKTPE